jgi:hypothetical protein
MKRAPDRTLITTGALIAAAGFLATAAAARALPGPQSCQHRDLSASGRPPSA